MNMILSSDKITNILQNANVIPIDIKVIDAYMSEDSLEGGRAGGSIHVVNLRYNKNEDTFPKTIIWKCVHPNRMLLNVEREAFFYNLFRGDFQHVPCYSSEVVDGRTEIFMQDLSHCTIRLDTFHGSQGDVSHDDLVAKNLIFSSVEAWEKAFVAVARTHAKYWNQKNLNNQQLSVLKNYNYLQRHDRERWENLRDVAQRAWKSVKKEGFDELVVRVITKSIEQSTFEGAMREYESRPLTLVHGDFHAKNLFVHKDTREILMTDFSEVGIGDPISDLTQYIISDVSIHDRRQNETRILRAYYDELIVNGVTDLTFDQLMQYYKTGLDRFIFLFPILAYSQFKPMYFHDQIQAFLVDHLPESESISLRGVVEINGSFVR